METLPVHVFKDSFGPFITLLNEHGVKYMMRDTRSAEPAMAASGIIELLQSAAMWGALATVAVAFIKSRNGRKIIITTNDKTVVQAEGLTQEELEKVFRQAKSLMVIATEERDKEATKKPG